MKNTARQFPPTFRRALGLPDELATLIR